MSGAPARGTVPRRQRRHHHHHHHHNHHHHLKRQKRVREETPRDSTLDESEEKRPKVNPIFLWASQREQRIIEVRCEDYDKRNRIKLTKTAQGWRSIPRTTSNVYTIACKKTSSLAESASPTPSVSSNDEKENGERHQEIATPNVTANSLRRNLRRYTANGATNGLLTGDDAGKKRRYNKEPKDIRRGYSYPLGARDDSNWNSDGQACPSDGNNDNENERRKDSDKDSEQKSVEIRQSSLKIKIKLNGRSNLERLQKDKLFQPRVVLEQLHLSQFPESMHQNIIRRMRNKDAAVKETERIERDDERHEEEDAVDEPEENEEEAHTYTYTVTRRMTFKTYN